MRLIEAHEVVHPGPANLDKLLKRFANQKHVIEHGIVKLLNPLQRLCTVVLRGNFALREPLKQTMAGVAIYHVLVDLFIPTNVVGNRDAAFAVNPGTEVGRVEQIVRVDYEVRIVQDAELLFVEQFASDFYVDSALFLEIECGIRCGKLFLPSCAAGEVGGQLSW